MAFTENLDVFFDTAGFAVPAAIANPNDENFDLRINVIFDASSQGIPIYGDTNVEAPAPQFRCKTSDLATVKRKFVATIGVQSFTIERMEAEDDGATSVVYLSR